MVVTIVIIACNLLTLNCYKIDIPTMATSASQCQEQSVGRVVKWIIDNPNLDIQLWKCEEDPTKENS